MRQIAHLARLGNCFLNRVTRLSTVALCLGVIASLPAPVFAADPVAQDFDIPAGQAGTTLDQFSAQVSGTARVLYSADAVQGVETNPVKGRFTVQQALEVMLSGTTLVAETDAHTGAVTVRRKPASRSGQTTMSPPQPGAADGAGQSEEVIQLSKFEVTTTQGHGYVSTNSASAFKTNESLMDIPQSLVVVTNDMISDINYENTSDVLQYFGIAAGFQGESLQLRGGSIGYPYIDDMPVVSSYQDNAFIDSYEVIKGPTEALYLSAPLSGVVLKATKKPLPYEQNILTASVDDNGLFRATVDSTGPVGNVGDLKLSYRFIGVDQTGNTYFKNIEDRREVLAPSLQASFHDTTVLLQFNFQRFHSESNGFDLVTPSGGLYTGAGRSEANQPPNNMDQYEYHSLVLKAFHKISENWEDRVSGMYFKQDRFNPIVLPTGGYDWGDQVEFFNHRLDNEIVTYWTVLDDVQGKYDLGPEQWKMKNVDVFGYAFFSRTDKQQYWTTAPFGDTVMGIPLVPFQPAGTLAVPMNNAAAINAIQVPGVQQYAANPPANFGSDGQIDFSTIYWQHSLEVVPDRLELIAAFTWDASKTESITNISILPWTGTIVSASQWLHRLGAVAHLTKEISLYALDSTAFSPPTGSNLLQSGQLVPSVSATGTETGVKWNFLGGRLSGESAWFKMVRSNVAVIAGSLQNGVLYYTPIGSTVQEGFDGDAAFQILPGWQLIGTFYAGHNRDQFNNPVSGSYDNSWSTFTRYDFSRTSALKGLNLGGGVTRIGGRWISDSGILNAPGLLPANGLIKLKTGTLLNGFLGYQYDSHWTVRVNCDNILDQTYPLAAQTAQVADPSPPRTWSFQTIYKF